MNSPGLVSLFNGIPVFVGCLMPKPILAENSCGTIRPTAKGGGFIGVSSEVF